MTKKICAIVGVGPGNGAALSRAFAGADYDVAMIARNTETLAEFERQIPGTRGVTADVTDPQALRDAFERIDKEMGAVDALIYNAGSGSFANVEETSLEEFERAWRVNSLGFLIAAKAVIPAMKSKGAGAIVAIGATASIRGRAQTTAFASAKAAQRSLAQSLARYLGPEGIHVGYIIIDGVIDLKRTREMMPDKPDSFFLQPDDIAKSVLAVVEQPKSAWTFEWDARPYAESW